MKKILFIAALACLSFAACEEMDNGVLGDITEHPILSDKSTEQLQPDEQQVKLESVAKKIMAECPVDDFEKISGIAEAFSNKFFSDDYNLDPLYDWFDNQIEDAYKENSNINISNGKVEITNTTDILVLIANHKGHFKFGDKALTIDNSYNGLKATLSLNGKNYEAVIEQSGKVTNAIYSFVENDISTGNGYWDDNKGQWVDVSSSTQVKDNWSMKFTVGVPERLDISIKENGSALAQVTARFAPNFTANGITPTKDSFSTEITIKVDAYEYIIEKLKYDGASGKAAQTVTLKKNGKTLVYSSVTGDVRFDIVTRSEQFENSSYEYQYVEVSLAKNIVAAVDILEEIQVIGTCSNALDASDALDAFWDALYPENGNADEKTAQRQLDNFNAAFDFGVFYDKGNNRQADLEFEYLDNSQIGSWDINGDGKIDQNDRYENYDMFPIIIFNNGARYSIEEFFTEKVFGNLIENFYEFCDDFSEMFGFSFAEEMEPVPDYGVM